MKHINRITMIWIVPQNLWNISGLKTTVCNIKNITRLSDIKPIRTQTGF